MDAGYEELVLTLQDIMYSNSELEYLTRERNFLPSRIENIRNKYNDEREYDRTVFTNCILVKKNTVDYLESSGYNLFRQFETSHDFDFFERSISRGTDNSGFETCGLFTSFEYSLDIYCYATPPVSTGTPRRYPAVPSFVYVTTQSQNSSDSPLYNFLTDDINGSDNMPAIPNPVSTARDSSVNDETRGCTSESIWGSTSRLPTTLVQPLSDTFWNDLANEQPLSDSSDSDETRGGGGIFVKLTTLNSTKRRTVRTSGSSTEDDGCVHDRLALPDANRLDSQATRVSMNSGMSGHSSGAWINGDQTNSDVDGCIVMEDSCLSKEMIDIEYRVGSKDEDPGKRNMSVAVLGATHEKIRGMEDSCNTSNETCEEVTKCINTNKRTASSPAVSPQKSFRCSKDLKESELSSDTTKYSYPNNYPLDLSMSGNRGSFVDDLELSDSSMEIMGKVSHQEYTKIKSFNSPSTSRDNSTDEEVLINNSNIIKNVHEEKVTGNKSKFSYSDKSTQKECSEERLKRNGSSFITNDSSSNEHSGMQHANPMTIVEYHREIFDDFRSRNIPENRESFNSPQHSKSFDTSRNPREPCDNSGLRPSLHQNQRESESFLNQPSFDSFPSQSNTFQGTRQQHISFDHIQDDRYASTEIRHQRTVDQDQVTDNQSALHQHIVNSPSHIEEHYPFENRALAMLSNERLISYGFSNQNRPTDSNLVWSRKCEDMQNLLCLKLSRPLLYVQEYNRIRKSSLNVLDCLRRRERSGALSQTKVLEVIAGPHYCIYPPADEDEIRRLQEEVHHEEDTDLAGYLMVSLLTHRTSLRFDPAENNDKNLLYITKDALERLYKRIG